MTGLTVELRSCFGKPHRWFSVAVKTLPRGWNVFPMEIQHDVVTNSQDSALLEISCNLEWMGVGGFVSVCFLE